MEQMKIYSSSRVKIFLNANETVSIEYRPFAPMPLVVFLWLFLSIFFYIMFRNSLNHPIRNENDSWMLALFILSFIGFPIGVAFLKKITTTIDLKKREVFVHETNLMKLDYFTYNFSFYIEDIKQIIVTQYGGGRGRAPGHAISLIVDNDDIAISGREIPFSDISTILNLLEKYFGKRIPTKFN